MSQDMLPTHYQWMQANYPDLIKAVNDLGKAAANGPIGPAQAQLIQLAASVANNNEGSVHSHTRRALSAGASPEEIRHAILLLTSTVGFSCVARAMSWVNDILGE